MTEPLVGLSRAPRILIRVVLPLPDLPLSTVSLPVSISILIFFKAETTLPSPILKSRHRFSVRRIVSNRFTAFLRELRQNYHIYNAQIHLPVFVHISHIVFRQIFRHNILFLLCKLFKKLTLFYHKMLEKLSKTIKWGDYANHNYNNYREICQVKENDYETIFSKLLYYYSHIWQTSFNFFVQLHDLYSSICNISLKVGVRNILFTHNFHFIYT
jgi:hypothetical protein